MPGDASEDYGFSFRRKNKTEVYGSDEISTTAVGKALWPVYFMAMRMVSEVIMGEKIVEQEC